MKILPYMLYYSLLFLNEWWKWIFQDRLPSVSCPSWDGFFIIDKSLFRSIVLDYDITINKLREADRIFVGGSLGNYSLAGFEMILRRHVSHYIINYYLPSGLFVVVSWISFLVPADIIPGTIQYTITIRKKQALHAVWKSQKKSHSTLRAKRATFKLRGQKFIKNAKNGQFWCDILRDFQTMWACYTVS